MAKRNRKPKQFVISGNVNDILANFEAEGKTDEVRVLKDIIARMSESPTEMGSMIHNEWSEDCETDVSLCVGKKVENWAKLGESAIYEDAQDYDIFLDDGEIHLLLIGANSIFSLMPPPDSEPKVKQIEWDKNHFVTTVVDNEGIETKLLSQAITVAFKHSVASEIE